MIWSMVCMDEKEGGGLGIGGLKFLNQALFGKWLWGFLLLGRAYIEEDLRDGTEERWRWLLVWVCEKTL